MSRRVATLSVAGLLVVVLSAVAALLPVPYVALLPGPTANTIGSKGSADLIQIEGRRTYPTDGHLDLTTVLVLGGPRNRMDLVTALRGWLDDTIAVVPEEQVYPGDQTAEEVKEQDIAQMRDSQENATTAALRQLGIPVDTTVLVDALSPGSPSEGKLEPGDVVLTVDGKPAVGGARLRELITAHEPGDPVDLVVRRDGTRVPVTVTTDAAEDGRAIIGVTTRDDATYPFTVKISLEDVGGPSAGLMFALGIIDKLTPGALTNGSFVAGTGEIDDGGNVGAIGGITQKMVAAERAGATVFLAPAGNCDEAAGTAPDGLRVVRVDTLDTAVGALEDLRTGDTDQLPTCATG
jgi:PDZ domain-containing protein